LPQSTHTVQLAYRLGDGRVSPSSALVSCTTWGADLNGDGVPDDWQSFNWGKPINWPNPALDSDGDGASNLAEFLAGTDPTNPDSVLKVVISTREQGPYVEWTTEPGSVYQLQISSDLKTWQNVGTQRFASSTSDAIPASQPGQGQYYRVIRMR
ncbi:MAG: thrombospondin type 3 repeat-containing protein, partial [Verrucomicrobiota bacterium]